jgi:hypothetical protein
MLFINVVFPTPLRPITQVISPAGTSMLTFRKTFTSPYENDKFSTFSTGLSPEKQAAIGGGSHSIFIFM